MKSSNKKELASKHYTPPSLAQFVVWSAFQQFFQQRLPKERWPKILFQKTKRTISKNTLDDSVFLEIQEQIKDIKILDLGVGDGAFLLAAGKFLETISPKTDSIDLNGKKLSIFNEKIFGVDYNPQAVQACRRKLKTWILGDSNSDQTSVFTKNVEKALTHQIRLGNVLLGNILPNEHKNISILLQDEEVGIKEKRIFHWYDEFPAIFNQKKPGFDLILCNPPYVTKDITPEDNRLYRKLYRKHIFVNRFNLYHLFFARLYNLLAPNGIAAFLTSNSVLTDYYSLKVRDFLFSHFYIKSIVDFVSRTQIFPKILQGTCVLVLCKKNRNKQEQHTHIIRTFDMATLNQGKSIERWIPTPQLIYFRKFIPSPFPQTFKILKLLDKTPIRLKDIVKVQSGEIRPADKKIRPYYFKTLPTDSNLDNFKIILNGKNIHPFKINLTDIRLKPRWYLRPSVTEDQIFRKNHTTAPRIVFQRITAREQLRRVVCSKIDKNHIKTHKQVWVENSVNYFLFDSSLIPISVSADALLGIFNSLLINWYIHQINLTAAIPPADLGLIPLPKLNTTNHDYWSLLQQKVSDLSKLLQQYSSSTEILTHLCPVCAKKGEIFNIHRSIDDLVFRLYDLPDIFKTEVIKQLSIHHHYFNHH